MMNGRPWFRFYPAEWLGSRETRLLTPEQRGYLIQLKAEAWRSEPCGSLPVDPEQLWKLAGALNRRRFAQTVGPVMALFRLADDRYWDEELMSLYSAMDTTSTERRIAGKLGAASRWQGSKQMANPFKSDGKQMANAISTSWQTDSDTDTEPEKKREPDSKHDGKTDTATGARVKSLGPMTGLTRAVFDMKALSPELSASDVNAKRLSEKQRLAAWEKKRNE